MKKLTYTIGILVLISTSIFACKNRKKGQKEAATTVTTESSPSKFKIPKMVDTALKTDIATFYVRSCGACHQPYEKTAYSKTSWAHILDSMQQRAHISNENKADLYLFLTGDSLKIDKHKFNTHPHKH